MFSVPTPIEGFKNGTSNDTSKSLDPPLHCIFVEIYTAKIRMSYFTRGNFLQIAEGRLLLKRGTCTWI